MWRSANEGTTWTQVTANAGWAARSGQNSVVMPDGSIVLMGGSNGSADLNDVWRSTDNGATWTEINANAGWGPRSGQSSAAMPDGSIVLMGGSNGSVYLNDVWRSTDNGATWTEMNASAGWAPRVAHASVAMADGSIVMTGGRVSNPSPEIEGNTRNDVWMSADNGATWTEMTVDAPWQTRGSHSSVVLADGSILVMGGYHHAEGNPYDPAGTTIFLNDVWRSADNGATWTQMVPPPMPQDVGNVATEEIGAGEVVNGDWQNSSSNRPDKCLCSPWSRIGCFNPSVTLAMSHQ